MKNFYTLSLALAVALTASAQKSTMGSGRVNGQLTPDVKVTKTIDIAANKQLKSPTFKAPGIVEGGIYEWSGYSLLSSGSPFGEVQVYDYDEATGEAMLYLGDNAGIIVPCTVDLTAGTLSIDNYLYIGDDSDGPVYFYIKPVSDGYVQSGMSDVEATVGVIDDSGLITFPTLDVWACGDPDNESLGYYFMTYGNVFEPEDPNADPNEGWTSVGNATFCDPWIIPALGEDPAEYPWTVELQRKDSDSNIYRLVDPYHAADCPLNNIDLNESTKAGYIQFNISDPKYVYFYPVEAGFANSELGITKFYCYNLLGWAMAYTGADAETIIYYYDDAFKFNTVFEDGVVTIGSQVIDGEIQNDACFGVQGEITGGYSWNNVGAVVGTITFPEDWNAGISSVAIDNSNAPVEYFNIQGVRVDNPSNGVFISRQGNVVKKVIK